MLRSSATKGNPKGKGKDEKGVTANDTGLVTCWTEILALIKLKTGDLSLPWLVPVT